MIDVWVHLGHFSGWPFARGKHDQGKKGAGLTKIIRNAFFRTGVLSLAIFDGGLEPRFEKRGSDRPKRRGNGATPGVPDNKKTTCD